MASSPQEARAVALLEPSPLELNDATSQNGRREGKRRRESRHVMLLPGDALSDGGDQESIESSPLADGGQDRRAARNDRRAEAKRSRAPRTARSTMRTFGGELEAAAPADDKPDANGAEAASPLPVLDLKGKGSARTAARVQKRQEAAATAIDNLDGDAALGAINRHLNVLTQQVTAAHRVLGRVAAERDALRQQVADLQGIPVEQVIVSTIGATNSTPEHARHETHAELEPHEKSRMEKLNYFGGDDFELMRKRRQLFVLILAVVGGLLALFARQMGWSFPDDISRDSLSALPFLGNLMTVFLAGWVFYRVIRVASKGVHWVFPSEHRARRRH